MSGISYEQTHAAGGGVIEARTYALSVSRVYVATDVGVFYLKNE